MPETSSTFSTFGYFFLGLFSIYVEIILKPEVDGIWKGPVEYIKKNSKTVFFSLFSFVIIFSTWYTTGVHIEINGEDLVNLQQGHFNALYIAAIAFSASTIFSGLLNKYTKFKTTRNGNGQ